MQERMTAQEYRDMRFGKGKRVVEPKRNSPQNTSNPTAPTVVPIERGVTQRFVVPGIMPTMNEILDASKSHYQRYSQMKRDATKTVVRCVQIDRIKPINFKITVHFLWVRPDKFTDPDNVSAATKFFMDGLQNAHILTNDGNVQIGRIVHDFATDKYKPRTEVTLSEYIE